MGTLYVVATPIGNLEDMTLRALRILKEADFVLAEDTRVTRKLFARYDIATKLMSYHQQSREQKKEEILGLLCEGKNLALVTDSGTPGISDPGNELIAYILSQEDATEGEVYSKLSRKIGIVPVPGPCALTALASISGFPMNEFLFLGFPPAKRKRKRFFEEIVSSNRPVIFYESPHRIIRTLKELEELDAGLEVVVGRELTKVFETVYRGRIGEVPGRLEQDKVRGEFAVAAFRFKQKHAGL
ncbi:16S rRNA (cytidine(1402)-2'-O)-methyltransferase [Patescibacteria group bacterium]|nr:16S rRNA (cytidine(1402)-2'-O)-methyltransferase [Patescibacteria group bacterium]